MGGWMFLHMENSLNTKSVTLGVILGICVSELWRLCKDEYINKRRKTSHIISDGLFFSPKKLLCTTKCCKQGSDSLQNSFLPCNGCSLKSLISVLGEAKKNLDVCMCLITSQEICDAILDLFRKGVRVRVIIDKHMSEDAYGADVVALRKEYVPIKVIQSSYIMHNKFVVIDKETVMSGSLNWTKQGLLGNYENVVIMTDKAVAKKFSDYFQFLWNLNEE